MGTVKTFATDAQHGPSIYEFLFNGETSKLTVFLNGSNLGETAYTSPPNQGNSITLFSNRGYGSYVDGFVGEVIGLSSLTATNTR